MNKATTKKSLKTYNSQAHPAKKRQSKDFHKVYWPYIPLLLVAFVSLFSGLFLPTTSPSPASPQSVLAYATEMSRSGLLSATNTQRSAAGAATLALNSKLNNAAQAKADDMVTRNYWSHNTPDGDPPWVFMSNAGYLYQKAGENLAYGFNSSNDTITGWMNSPGHKANMLDTAFNEVGFGFANSSNFVSTGPETVVVAMYGKPQVLAVAEEQPTPSPPPAAPVEQPPTAQASANDSTPPAAKPPELVEEEPQKPTSTKEPFTSETPTGHSPEPAAISRIQRLTNGEAPWSAGIVAFITTATLGFWVLRHAVAVKKVLATGETFAMHHPIIDLTIAGIIALMVYLSSTSGVIL